MRFNREKRVYRGGTTEEMIQKAGRDLLIMDGWRLVETDPRKLRGLAVIEPGIADDLFIRYKYTVPETHLLYNGWTRVDAEVLWIEWKREKDGKATKLAEKQKEWHRRERARGAATLKAGVSFPATVDGFRDWYFSSGLANKVRPSGPSRSKP